MSYRIDVYYSNVGVEKKCCLKSFDEEPELIRAAMEITGRQRLERGFNPMKTIERQLDEEDQDIPDSPESHSYPEQRSRKIIN